jgi:hypothetical protein
VDYESYLISKKIDSAAFQQAEPELWKAWNLEFEQMHPDSFTMQKLNLINPVRRKYTLHSPPQKVDELPEKQVPTASQSTEEEIKPASTPSVKPKPIMAKPVFKPKPKT